MAPALREALGRRFPLAAEAPRRAGEAVLRSPYQSLYGSASAVGTAEGLSSRRGPRSRVHDQMTRPLGVSWRTRAR
jgi:hypothetical protein